MTRTVKYKVFALLIAVQLVFSLGVVGVKRAAAASSTGAPVTVAAPSLAGLDQINLLYELVTQMYAGQADADRLVEEALRGFIAGLGDPYSMYLTKEELDSLNSEITGTFSGIGIGIEWVNNVPTVSQVYPDTPAAGAGLRLGDQLLAIDGVSTEGMTTGDLVGRLRGDTGTTVQVRVLHADGRLGDYTLVRAPIDISPVTYEIKDGNIAYVRLSVFSEGAASDFAAALADMQSKTDIKGLILDLRDNGGGLLTEAYMIASMLVPQGSLVKIVDAAGNEQVLTSYVTEPLRYPYIVLVNGNSASASEIVAGAVKDHGYGLLVGQTTFGKGSVQTVFSFAGGDGIRLTTAHFYTPLGHQIHGAGIEPNVYVEPAGTFPGGRVEGRIGQRDLRPGMVGLDVLELQQDLSLAKYYDGPLDGVFGDPLKEALLQFRYKFGVINPFGLTPSMQTFIADKAQALAADVQAPEIDAALALFKQAFAQQN